MFVGRRQWERKTRKMEENEQEQLPRDSLKKLELYRSKIHFES